jgi:hypothetical protein
MAERSVEVSIVVEVSGGKRIAAELAVTGEACEEAIHSGLKRIGREMVGAVLAELDDRLREDVPPDWRNVGKEERKMLTILGPVRIRRRVYRDREGARHKPLDEELRLRKYDRVSEALKAKGAYLASGVSYREAASMLSWMLDEKVNHSRIQSIAWEVGTALDESERQQREAIFTRGEDIEAGKIAASTLYGESDGVHIHLQREGKRSAEVRVGIMYTGKRAVGVGRRALENKVCLTTLVDDSQEWQEKVLKTAYANYDLENTTQLVIGGDGNSWVRHSFDRLEIKQVFQLDRFHLYRAARRALGYDKETNQLAHRCCTLGLGSVEDELKELLSNAVGCRRDKIGEFIKYLYQNADVLVDYDRRLPPGSGKRGGLGAIEGNVDKLVVYRMKGRGRSWRRVGAKAMLALCRHKTALQQKAFRLPQTQPDEAPTCPRRRTRIKDADWFQHNVPVLHSSAEGRPWVKTLRKRINGSSDPSFI